MKKFSIKKAKTKGVYWIESRPKNGKQLTFCITCSPEQSRDICHGFNLAYELGRYDMDKEVSDRAEKLMTKFGI